MQDMEYSVDFEESMKMLLHEAMTELAQEEEQRTEHNFDPNEFGGIKGGENETNFYIEQDIQAILDDAKLEREAREYGLIEPEKGTRKFATVPMAAIIDYKNKFGVDILDAETSRDQWEMAKFRMWIQREHPQLMVRETGKTKFHTMK